MRSHLPLAMVVALAALPLPAQELDDVYLKAVLLVQFGPGDLVLNSALLEAMTNEPSCLHDLKRALGDALVDVQRIEVQLPAAHLAGTFQLHVVPTLTIKGQWSDQQRDIAIDTIVAHLKRRLDEVLYDEPTRQLTTRRDELLRRHADLQGQRAVLVARAEAATANMATLQRQREALEQQLLATRLEVATETRGKEHLEKLHAESTAHREEVQAEIVRQNMDLITLQRRLNDLSRRLETAPKDENEKLRTEVGAIPDELQAKRTAIDHFKEVAADQQRMHAVVLEQLPASALATLRANARLQSLSEEGKALEERLAKAAAERAQAGHYEAEAERLQIDIAVGRTLLTEIQGKLARLQPVHYELLRQR